MNAIAKGLTYEMWSALPKEEFTDADFQELREIIVENPFHALLQQKSYLKAVMTVDDRSRVPGGTHENAMKDLIEICQKSLKYPLPRVHRIARAILTLYELMHWVVDRITATWLKQLLATLTPANYKQASLRAFFTLIESMPIRGLTVREQGTPAVGGRENDAVLIDQMRRAGPFRSRNDVNENTSRTEHVT